MQAIDCYREFLNKSNITLEEASFLNDLSNLTTQCIYINKLVDPIIISSASDDDIKYFVYGSSSDIDEYLVFYTDIFDDKYTVLVTNNDANLLIYIYNSELLFGFQYYFDRRNFAHFFKLDSLVSKACEYINFMLSLTGEKEQSYCTLNSINLDYDFFSNCSLNISHKILTDLNQYLNLSYNIEGNHDKQNGHISIFIYNGVLSLLAYINQSHYKRILDKKPMGELKDILFYFPIDKDRTLMIEESTYTFLFCECGKLINFSIYSHFEDYKRIFKLLNRMDIYELLKKAGCSGNAY